MRPLDGLRRRLAAYGLPQRIGRVERLPRTIRLFRPGAFRAEIFRSYQADSRHAPVPAGWTELVVGTWNIHSCIGGDSRFAPERIAQIIRDMNTDLIGLQEVGWHHRGQVGMDQYAFLQNATGMQMLAAPTKHHRRAHYGNALLTRLPVEQLMPLDLSLPRREPRGGLSVVLRLADGRLVRVLVAHLGLDPWERASQIDRLRQHLAALPPLPTILMGDLNEWRSRAPALRRLSADFADAGAPRSFPARLPTLRLDRILVTGGVRLAAFRAVRSPATRVASDHLPVRAVLALPPLS